LQLYHLLKPLLFSLDAEMAHEYTMGMWQKLSKLPPFNSLFLTEKDAPVYCSGLTFKNPVGLAAGFDKNARYIQSMATLGFGHIEIGTVTPKPQSGNDKPRMFRLVKDKALINRMGFNNDGAVTVAQRLSKLKRPPGLIVGGNIGKNKDTPNQEAPADYRFCIEQLYDYVDYFTVNVSSPNTPGLRDLLMKGPLTELLEEVQIANKAKGGKPIFLKIAPDLNTHQLDDIVDTVKETGIAAIIATNTTNTRNNLHYSNDELAKFGAGGLSGAPLSSMAHYVLKYLKARSEGSIELIASGGVMQPADVKSRLAAGATLVQIYTGMIYYGPRLVKDSIDQLHQ
jgi:dihydroorotate dehydrogenase